MNPFSRDCQPHVSKFSINSLVEVSQTIFYREVEFIYELGLSGVIYYD